MKITGTWWLGTMVLCLAALLAPSALSSQTSILQKGKASYYAKSWTGRRTSNGERLHHDSLTCAHKSYPFGTLLRVTNIINGLQVVVRVTDRGPYVRGRIVDLSWGAAKAIGMLSQGVAPVTVERLKGMSIPYLPDDDDMSYSAFEFEVADIAPTGIVPVWQYETRIDSRKVQRSMHRVARKSAREAASSAVLKDNTSEAGGTVASGGQTQERDVLDEMNEKPNTSRVYLKREGKK